MARNHGKNAGGAHFVVSFPVNKHSVSAGQRRRNMPNEPFTVTALWKRGDYTMEEAANIPYFERETEIFTAHGMEGICLRKSTDAEKNTFALWEMDGFFLHHAVLPLLRLMEKEGVRVCPCAVSDTRLTFLVPSSLDRKCLSSLRAVCTAHMA